MSRNLPKPPSALFQFLVEGGFVETLATLEKESGTKYNPEDVPLSGTLLQALALLEEKQNNVEEIVDEKAEGIRRVLNTPPDGSCANSCSRSLDQIHVSAILTSQFLPNSEKFIITGGADKTIRISDVATQSMKQCIKLPAPILSLDICKTNSTLIAASCMDGSHHIVDSQNPSEIKSFLDHSKYIVCIKFSPDGTCIATASYDKTCKIYRKTGLTWEFDATLEYDGVVEALEWVQVGGKSYLVIAVRGDHILHYILQETLQEDIRINMNINGDSFVSFSVMHLVVSQDSRLLLAATDSSFMILFETGTGTQHRKFYGCPADEYSYPRCAFSKNETYVYCTSLDRSIYCWSVKNQALVAQMTGHKDKVRSLTRSNESDSLVTCSFDRTVRIWTGSK